MSGPPRPLLVFDGDCGFCRAWVGRWRQRFGDRVDVAPSQAVAASYPEIPAATFAQAVVLIEPDGEVATGAAAVFRALAHAPRGGLGLRAYRHVPGFAAASEVAYHLIARNRGPAAVVTRALWGAHVAPPGERLTAWIFVRLVGVLFVVACASLTVQVRGLIGAHGILPAAALLAQVASHYGPERFWLLPTLAWLNASDAFLVGLGIAGMVAGALAALGVAPRATLLAAWACYLSLTSVGGDFLWFQWDGLMLECGIVAALLAPWRAWSGPRDDWRPTRAAVWLSRWLLFRLMFSSAVVKWASGDPSWRHLTALQHHYETQPLPPWTAWYAHHLPASFQAFSALMMFAIEGLVPFLVFAPRRVRMLGGAAMVFLQTLILLTGNYGFFNWLTLALCVMLLDDGAWPAWLRERAAPRAAEAVAPADAAPRRAPGRRAASAIAIALIVLGVVPIPGSLRIGGPLLAPLRAVYGAIEPLRSINPYGLFAVMTTRRLEIEVEGSDDGVSWRAYEFRWKPGDVGRRPAFVLGHMPRLDWQMWFAALDPTHPAYWFVSFARALLAGSRPVLGLLGRNPFPEHPPRFVRARLFEYRFTDAATRRATGAWWSRTPAGEYLPPLRLENGMLVPAEGLEGR